MTVWGRMNKYLEIIENWAREKEIAKVDEDEEVEENGYYDVY